VLTILDSSRRKEAVLYVFFIVKVIKGKIIKNKNKNKSSLEKINKIP